MNFGRGINATFCPCRVQPYIEKLNKFSISNYSYARSFGSIVLSAPWPLACSFGHSPPRYFLEIPVAHPSPLWYIPRLLRYKVLILRGLGFNICLLVSTSKSSPELFPSLCTSLVGCMLPWGVPESPWETGGNYGKRIQSNVQVRYKRL